MSSISLRKAIGITFFYSLVCSPVFRNSQHPQLFIAVAVLLWMTTKALGFTPKNCLHTQHFAHYYRAPLNIFTSPLGHFVVHKPYLRIFARQREGLPTPTSTRLHKWKTKHVLMTAPKQEELGSLKIFAY